MDVDGKVAIVTGGAQGIGKAICTSLLQKGIKVCIADWNKDTGNETVSYFNHKYGQNSSMFYQVDVRKEDSIESAIKATMKHFGSVDIFVNNAGISNENDVQRIIDINLVGVIYGNLLSLKHMPNNASRKGVVVNISSVQGLSVGEISPIYTASKFGVVGITRALAASYPDSGVRFNTVCPCFTRTEMLKSEELLDDVGKRLVKQFGIIEPSLIGEAVLQLIQDESKNGHVLVASKYRGIVDGPMPKMEDIVGQAPS